VPASPAVEVVTVGTCLGPSPDRLALLQKIFIAAGG